MVAKSCIWLDEDVSAVVGLVVLLLYTVNGWMDGLITEVR